MDQWQRVVAEMLEEMAQEVEHFFAEIIEVVDILADTAEDVAEEAHKAIATELERAFPFLSTNQPWIEFWDFEDPEDYDMYGVEPLSEQPAACRGCQHFHGQVYGGTTLICAMHPYGPEAEQCLDWDGLHPNS
jgi:hypothetical protein